MQNKAILTTSALIVFFIFILIFSNSSDVNDRSSVSTASIPPKNTNYSPIPTPTTSLPPLIQRNFNPTFNGYTCTDDCSGHEAGYEWAEENGIDDIDDCGGNSNSFIEGCQSYVEENSSNYSDLEDEDDENYF